MIKVLVVDDSALIRSLLGEIIKSDPALELVGAAPDPYVARDMVNRFAPDVITLDVEMPRMDGLTFLKKLMKARPTPVLMISTLTIAGADVTLAALDAGAVDFVPKPKLDIAAGIEQYRSLILNKIKMAAVAKPQQVVAPAPVKSVQRRIDRATSQQLIAIGASTGGTVALKQLFQQLPADLPGIVVVQHMPAGFTKTFAERLNLSCPQQIQEAKHGELVLPGHVYIAPGDSHMEVIAQQDGYHIVLNDGPRVSGHRPSVDVLFKSVAEVGQQYAIALILTGMGNDGAIGCQHISHHGGFCIAQDEQSSVVFGMPQAAVQTGAVHEVSALTDMGAALLAQLH